MRARDELRVSVIRFLRASLQNEQIARGRSLQDSDVWEVIARQVKQRRDSIDQFRKGKREDLAQREESELAILEKYIPARMSREDILAAARQVAQELGARGPGDKGKVMGQLMPRLRGKADGAAVNSVVSELLAELAAGG